MYATIACTLTAPCNFQIQNLGDPGPIVYSFSEKPALRDFVNYNETHDDHLESRSHKVILPPPFGKVQNVSLKTVALIEKSIIFDQYRH